MTVDLSTTPSCPAILMNDWLQAPKSIPAPPPVTLPPQVVIAPSEPILPQSAIQAPSIPRSVQVDSNLPDNEVTRAAKDALTNPAPFVPQAPDPAIQQSLISSLPGLSVAPGRPGSTVDQSATTLTPVFSDDFSGSSIDQTKWGFNYPWSDECANNSNADMRQYAAYVSPNCPSQAGAADVFSTGPNGLNIAIKATPPGVNAAGKPYVTGQIESAKEFQYGYFEMTAKLPATKGIGGAFWLIPTQDWPPEIDVMENLGQDPNTIYQTAHDGSKGVETSPQQQVPVSVPGGVQNAFHTYAVDWGPSKATFFFDGKATQTINTPASWQQPMRMIVSMNSAPPGNASWGSSVDSTTQFPANYQIKDVRVFATNPYAGK
jgi:beta-glucanase (GH16 family)